MVINTLLFYSKNENFIKPIKKYGEKELRMSLFWT